MKNKNQNMFLIETLIKVFQEAIPVYQKAVNENWSYSSLSFNYLEKGICYFSGSNFNIRIVEPFKRYYANYINESYYLFNIALCSTNEIEESIKPRLEFMKSEIIELKKLLKRGYTHI